MILIEGWKDLKNGDLFCYLYSANVTKQITIYKVEWVQGTPYASNILEWSCLIPTTKPNVPCRVHTDIVSIPNKVTLHLNNIEFQTKYSNIFKLEHDEELNIISELI